MLYRCSYKTPAQFFNIIMNGISYGELLTYGDIIGAGGNLTGYGGGIKNKIELLRLEGNNVNKNFVSKNHGDPGASRFKERLTTMTFLEHW